ncbi:TAT-variant-translocated molybdopterin oxidoreductase [Schlesneria paludicola]|uniref:TAT-variant-translocated molybdopterin oxidoreductase n=1 Tax=Schlesneria paludicola TaxID=360056 RepID=UPI0012F7325D|nr:TAT-variant-translocated molybdopterin oxidoreductase [Schlesneria paludicola]
MSDPVFDTTEQSRKIAGRVNDAEELRQLFDVDRTGQPFSSVPKVDPNRPWRSLAELSETEEFIDFLHREFPRQASEWPDSASRRSFLKLMAGSLGLAGVGISGCMRQPEEKIVPYVRQPEDFVPGKPLFYATSHLRSGYATGLLVKSHLGRPIKIEGHPEHPASLGATDTFAQASILSLYDPDRSQNTLHAGRISTWGEFLTDLTARMGAIRTERGRGFAILTETVTSPSLGQQLTSLRSNYPEATWHQYEPVTRDNARKGAQIAFGEFVETIYHIDQADVILTLDADFLADMPGSVRYVRDFINRRKQSLAENDGPQTSRSMNRLFAVESTPGLTGAQADHRLPLPARAVEGLARIIARQLGVSVADSRFELSAHIPDNWLKTVTEELKSHEGRSLVIPGEGQPAVVHALCHAMNRQLNNVGSTVEYLKTVEPEPTDQLESLRQLVSRMTQGETQLLIVVGGNPVYNAPAELGFAQAFDRVACRVHLALEYDETSFASHWHLPQAHPLESWGDARAFDGTVTLQQPLIAPLFGGRTAYELLAAVDGHPERSAYDTIQQFWRQEFTDQFETRWPRAVHDGVIPGSRLASYEPEWKFIDQETEAISSGVATRSDDMTLFEVTFPPDPSVFDGRYANNGWLQELPKPLTKLTWGNAALLSVSTARHLEVANEDLIELSLDGRTVTAAVLIVPGQPDDSISLSLGYGRRHCGRIGQGVGADAYRIRPARSEWFAAGVTVRRTGEQHALAVTQNHHSMEGRDLIPVLSLAQFRQNPESLSEERRHPHEQPTLYPKPEPSENAWGMVIDQTACIGCNACVVACQSENNIPIVGKEQVRIGREMHWLRIDRYYRGGIEAPETVFQPVMCVHCENAPCELVCPVAATVHSHEGLNQMIYNRCVGTRYCSNNCPYKVRRFNFLDYDRHFEYDSEHAPSLSLLRNPDVTVRSRGVMEKCTYCVQRINHAKIEAQKERRPVRDGEVVTACQQVCPAQAIAFGNVADRESAVSKIKESTLNYSLLAELNTLPRTTHLARVRNPHPDLEEAPANDERLFQLIISKPEAS